MLTLGSGFLNRVGCSTLSVKLLLIFKQEAVDFCNLIPYSEAARISGRVAGGNMSLKSSYPRAAISVFLATAVATVFTLRSFATPEKRYPPSDSDYQGCTGALTVKSGQVTINGNPAQTGATVLTGSVIATGSNGKAVIDLATLGRIEVGNNTSISLNCTPALLEITSSCGKTEVEVRRGTIDVKSPKTETLTSGKKSKYDGGVNIASTGNVDVRIECEGHRTGIGPFVGPGLIGLLAVIGIGAAVAIGVASGGGGETVSSP